MDEERTLTMATNKTDSHQTHVDDVPGRSDQRNMDIASGSGNAGNRPVKSGRRQSRFMNVANSMFAGAEAQMQYFVLVEKIQNEQNNFADLNYKKRLDGVKRVLGITDVNDALAVHRVVMKKFKRRTDTQYKVEVQLKSSEDMNKLLKVDMIAGCKVKVSENISKNTIKGIIIDHADDLKGMTKEELLEAATLQGIREIHRFGLSKVLKISFSGQELPDRVSFWNELSFKVKKFYKPPNRCFKCQQYGHMSASCRYKFACYKCAVTYEQEGHHNPRSCDRDKKCVNCGGGHEAGNRDCEKHKMEVKWSKISEDLNINVAEARRKYPDGNPPSYANAAGGTTDHQPHPPVTARKENNEAMEERRQQFQEWREEQEKWKEQQENVTKQMIERLSAQEQESKILQEKLKVQTGVIAALQQQLKEKDEEITSLTNEKNLLEVDVDRLRTDSNKSMALTIKSLTNKLKDKDKQLQNYFKKEDTPKNKGGKKQ